MQNSVELLEKKYKEIKEIGFHKSINNYKNSGGMTLEKLLNSSGGDFNIPDFYDIEIKAIHNNFNKHIDLFSSAPDGSIINATKWISQEYGYPDRNYPNVKVLKGDIFANKLSMIGNRYLFRIKIDTIKEKIILEVLDHELHLLNNDLYWDFDSIKDKLIRKLSKLAIFYFEKKWINNELYFNYNKLNIYELISFDKFIECLKNGYVYMVFKTGVVKKGIHNGEFKNHGTSFRISVDKIHYLFNKIR